MPAGTTEPFNIPDSLADSPFIELGCPFTLYEAFKMVLLLPLLPFRLAVGGVALVAIAVINSLAAWNWPSEKPLTPWRRNLVLFSKELVLITLWCLGFRIRVKGRENIKIAERLGAVAIFNHVAWIDAFVLVWLMAPSGVSKESNSRIPVISRAVRALQTVYIPYDRLSKRAGSASGGGGAISVAAGSNMAHAEAASPAAAAAGRAREALASPPLRPEPPRRASDVVPSKVTEVLLRRVQHPSYCKHGGFPIVAMAPEGTTGSGRGLLNFRTGAFVLQRPVLPICFRYRWRGLNPAWTLGDERWHFLRLMSQFRNDLEVEILPPYNPSDEELKDPKLFASHVRRLMGAVLDTPLLDVSHDDYLALLRRGVSVSWDGRHVIMPKGAAAAP